MGVLRLHREDGQDQDAQEGAPEYGQPLGGIKDCMEHETRRSVRTSCASSVRSCFLRWWPWNGSGSGRSWCRSGSSFSRAGDLSRCLVHCDSDREWL